MLTLESFKKKNSQPPESSILVMLKDEIESYSNLNSVFCVFDALDEISEHNRLSIINHLVADLPFKARMIFTFRDLPDISDLFQMRSDGRRLEISGQNQDLETYIEYFFKENPEFTRLIDPERKGPGKAKVVETVIKKADGMYGSTILTSLHKINLLTKVLNVPSDDGAAPRSVHAKSPFCCSRQDPKHPFRDVYRNSETFPRSSKGS